jgi:hypothetical protein
LRLCFRNPLLVRRAILADAVGMEGLSNERATIAVVVLLSLFPIAQSKPIALKVGEPFTAARMKLYADGWRADRFAHSANGDYMGLERQLMQRGYSEVEVCSLGLSFCILQYTKGKECLRLQTQGEQIRFMKVDRWSNECRDQGEDDGLSRLTNFNQTISALEVVSNDTKTNTRLFCSTPTIRICGYSSTAKGNVIHCCAQAAAEGEMAAS